MYVCAVQRTYVCTYVRAYMHNMCICTLHICICMYVHTLFIIALTVGRIEVLNLPLYVFTTIGITANTLWFYYLLLGATYVCACIHAYVPKTVQSMYASLHKTRAHTYIRMYVRTYVPNTIFDALNSRYNCGYVRTYVHTYACVRAYMHLHLFRSSNY